MLTVGVTRRAVTSGRASGRGERGRGCGKVRQYEQTCPWSVSSVQSVENHSSSFSFRLFVFVSCALTPASVCSRHAKLVKSGIQRATGDSWSTDDKSPSDKSWNIVRIIGERKLRLRKDRSRESVMKNDAQNAENYLEHN